MPVFLICSSHWACTQAQPRKTQTGGADYYRQFLKAQGLAKRHDFAQAASLYEQLTRAYPEDAEVWMELASARAKSQQFRAGAEAYEKALARGGEYEGLLAYRIARLYALAGDRNQSLAWLEKSLAMPLENRPQIANDDAFSSWQNDERFRRLAGFAPKRTFSREEGWNYDLDFLVSEIRRMHYAYRSGPLPQGFEDDVRALRKRIGQLSDSAMQPEIQRLLARLGDGHTVLSGVPPRGIPVRLYEFSDGMFVIDAPEDCHCIGERVTALGSTPIQSAVQKITPFLSVDNSMGVRMQAPLYLR
jgi:tetratricopeptide (TPR) repeat protein